jgi:hypothetical protein
VRVLVACEFSGIVRDAFTEQGHEAWSMDLVPTERPGLHLEGEVQALLDVEWDLLVAHPPCTYLASSGERWLKGNPARQALRVEARAFVLQLWHSRAKRVAIENPIGHLSTSWQRPTQIVQPFWFGHPEWKSTCLWLRNLPKLVPTLIVEPDCTSGGGKKPGRVSSRIHRLPPSPTRQRERSRTFKGLAEAMALQWGNL